MAQVSCQGGSILICPADLSLATDQSVVNLTDQTVPTSHIRTQTCTVLEEED
jgi:hypothetical protein